MMSAPQHAGDLELRRYFIGELDEAHCAEVQSHLESCEVCRARIEALVTEQREFQERFSFERFAAGIDDAQAQAARPRASAPRALRWAGPAMGLAAAAAVALVWMLPADGPNRIKGGGPVADVVFYVGGSGGSRVAASPEPLGAGERLRIAYRPGGFTHLVAVSVDEAGEVSALYPEAGESLTMDAPETSTRLLPDSVEFTGQGLERVVVVLTDEPLEVNRALDAVREAWEASGGDVDRMPPLELPGEHFHRLLIKP